MTEINFNLTHPELRDDEVFLGNFEYGDIFVYGYKTQRTGVVAYDKHGNVLPHYFPMFVSREERENKLKPKNQNVIVQEKKEKQIMKQFVFGLSLIVVGIVLLVAGLKSGLLFVLLGGCFQFWAIVVERRKMVALNNLMKLELSRLVDEELITEPIATHPDVLITFEFDGKKYQVGQDAYKGFPIKLPDGRILEVAMWLDSFPPIPHGLTVINNTMFKTVKAVEVKES